MRRASRQVSLLPESRRQRQKVDLERVAGSDGLYSNGLSISPIAFVSRNNQLMRLRDSHVISQAANSSFCSTSPRAADSISRTSRLAHTVPTRHSSLHVRISSFPFPFPFPFSYQCNDVSHGSLLMVTSNETRQHDYSTSAFRAQNRATSSAELLAEKFPYIDQASDSGGNSQLANSSWKRISLGGAKSNPAGRDGKDSSDSDSDSDDGAAYLEEEELFTHPPRKAKIRYGVFKVLGTVFIGTFSGLGIGHLFAETLRHFGLAPAKEDNDDDDGGNEDKKH